MDAFFSRNDRGFQDVCFSMLGLVVLYWNFDHICSGSSRCIVAELNQAEPKAESVFFCVIEFVEL